MIHITQERARQIVELVFVCAQKTRSIIAESMGTGEGSLAILVLSSLFPKEFGSLSSFHAAQKMLDKERITAQDMTNLMYLVRESGPTRIVVEAAWRERWHEEGSIYIDCPMFSIDGVSV